MLGRLNLYELADQARKSGMTLHAKGNSVYLQCNEQEPLSLEIGRKSAESWPA